MEREQFLIHMEMFLNSYNYSKYLDMIYNILNSETEEEAIIKLNKYKLTEQKYNYYLNLFKKKFPNQIQEYEFLSSLYKKCQEYFGLNKEHKTKDFSIYLNTIKEIIESGYSVEEFCSMYGKYTLNQIDDMASKIKLVYPDIYNEFMDLCTKSSEKFYTYIKWVVIDIKYNPNFDIFDYYYYTKLNPIDFLIICKKILTKKQYQEIHPIVNKFIKVKDAKFNKEYELKGKTIIKNTEISKKEKENIFEFLSENNMPFHTYKAALRKYINGDYRIIEYIEEREKILCKR